MPKKPHPAAASLSAPSTAGVDENIHITGTGYTPGVAAMVLVESPTVRAWAGATIDPAGNLTCDWRIPEAGHATLTAYQGDHALATTGITIA